MSTEKTNADTELGCDALFSPNNLKHSIYDHGGSRIFYEMGETRSLVLDTYHPDEKFAVAAGSFVEEYFRENR